MSSTRVTTVGFFVNKENELQSARNLVTKSGEPKFYAHCWLLILSTSHLLIAFSSKKVITTMVIRPFDGPTWCAQSLVADLAAISKGGFLTPRFWRSGDVGGRGRAHSMPPNGFLLAPHWHIRSTSYRFLSYLSGSKSPPARPTRKRWQMANTAAKTNQQQRMLNCISQHRGNFCIKKCFFSDLLHRRNSNVTE